MRDPLEVAVRRVVAAGNCSGCGGCSLAFDRVSMRRTPEGYLRPSVVRTDSGSNARREARDFKRLCPGSQLRAPTVRESRAEHPVFGHYMSIHEAWAIDPAVRLAGSSGGVLTALSSWLIETGRAKVVIGAGASSSDPSQTVPVVVEDHADAARLAGSRYAPVAVLDTMAIDQPQSVVIGKPCEISALRQVREVRGDSQDPNVLRMSFFCAGTPSQLSTTALLKSAGLRTDAVSALRYRGSGWPGTFKAVDVDGREVELSYEESWGRHLGRSLQWRCRICVESTGEDADISIGDYWRTDEAGYPTFSEGAGVSILIARTARGEAIVREAVAAGVLGTGPASMVHLESIQPLQVDRRQTVAARVLARVLAGKRIPQYRGYHMLRKLARAPFRGARAFAGTLVRTYQRSSA